MKKVNDLWRKQTGWVVEAVSNSFVSNTGSVFNAGSITLDNT